MNRRDLYSLLLSLAGAGLMLVSRDVVPDVLEALFLWPAPSGGFVDGRVALAACGAVSLCTGLSTLVWSRSLRFRSPRLLWEGLPGLLLLAVGLALLDRAAEASKFVDVLRTAVVMVDRAHIPYMVAASRVPVWCSLLPVAGLVVLAIGLRTGSESSAPPERARLRRAAALVLLSFGTLYSAVCFWLHRVLAGIREAEIAVGPREELGSMPALLQTHAVAVTLLGIAGGLLVLDSLWRRSTRASR